MNIAISLNRKYVNYAYVMLTSLFENNNKENISVFALHNELLEQDIYLLSSLCKKYNNTLHPIVINESVLLHLPTTEMWSKEAYFRLALTDVLPKEVDRVLYLDIDMIIIGDISDLYYVDFDGKDFTACREFGEEETIPDRINDLFDGDNKKSRDYFNSGMMLWNISKLRTDSKYNIDYYVELSRRIINKLVAVDQDILNYVHFGSVKYVDKFKWDLYARTSFFDGVNLEKIKSETKIIHYIGDKPWLSKNFHFDIEYLWWEYAMKTPLYEELSKDFIRSTFVDHVAITRARELENQLIDITNSFNESVNINRKLLTKIGAKKDIKSKISIIVPCYNQSKYIRECLDSIYNQTYPAEYLEIILVDDGSTDDTPTIIKGYESKHQNNTLVILCEENSGGYPGKVRNTGLMYASGEYIVFIDSDDVVDSRYIERLYDSISSIDAEVASCNYWLLNDDGNTEKAIDKIEHLYETINVTSKKALLMQEGAHGYVMCKMYKKAFLDEYGILYSESVHVSEDTFFHWQILLYCKRYVVINDNLYFYRINDQSLWNGSKVTSYISDCFEIQMALCELFKNKNISNVREELEWNLMAAMLSVKSKCIDNNNYDLFIEYYTQIRKKIFNYYPDILNNSYIKKNTELKSLLEM